MAAKDSPLLDRPARGPREGIGRTPGECIRSKNLPGKASDQPGFEEPPSSLAFLPAELPPSLDERLDGKLDQIGFRKRVSFPIFADRHLPVVYAAFPICVLDVDPKTFVLEHDLVPGEDR